MAQWSGLGWLVSLGSTLYNNGSRANARRRDSATPFELFRLPDVLARLILDWLGLKYVVQLDSALCNSTFRSQFYCLAYSQHTTFTLSPHGQYKDFTAIMRWATLRNVKLDGFYLLQQCISDELLQSFIALSGSAVRWVASPPVGRAECCVRQQILTDIATRCPHIQTVVVRGEQIEDWGECLILLTKTLTKLTHLSLTEVAISRVQLATILTHCTQLEGLDLWSNNTVIPAEVALPTLRSLMTYSDCLSDEVLITIGQRCAKLETLHMFKPSRWTADPHRITEVGVRAVLQGCPLLRDTDVEEAGGISSELRLELTRRRCFTDLRLDRWKDLTEDLALEILKVSPSLTNLNCKSLAELTDAVLVVCAQHCPLLESITLEDCTWMTNDGVRALVSCLGSKLREVRLGSHIQLSDDAVLAVAQHCPRLEQVSCPRLTLNTTVVKLAKACPRLTHVYLCDTKVSDVGLTALATHCVHLKEVYLYDCWGVTMYGVRTLATHSKQLTKLALNISLSHHKLPPQLRRNSTCVVVYG
jgi:hypothetical protein